jgi:Butirosin biosynthesis protein H, N-terminal
VSNLTYPGRHYETGTIANTLLAMGALDPRTNQPFSEADVLGASGGIAFGYFVFEYDGYLPHVALLPRNTFDPFNRALDNLGVRREVRESTSEEKGEANLRRELDMGNSVLVWADLFSMPFLQTSRKDMWMMSPVLVVGFEDGAYQVVDGTQKPFPMSPEELIKAGVE